MFTYLDSWLQRVGAKRCRVDIVVAPSVTNYETVSSKYTLISRYRYVYYTPPPLERSGYSFGHIPGMRGLHPLKTQ